MFILKLILFSTRRASNATLERVSDNNVHLICCNSMLSIRLGVGLGCVELGGEVQIPEQCEEVDAECLVGDGDELQI